MDITVVRLDSRQALRPAPMLPSHLSQIRHKERFIAVDDERLLDYAGDMALNGEVNQLFRRRDPGNHPPACRRCRCREGFGRQDTDMLVEVAKQRPRERSAKKTPRTVRAI